MKNLFMILVLTSLLAVAQRTSAAIIDFNGIAPGPVIGTASEDGYTITSPLGRTWGPFWGFPDASIGTSAANQSVDFSFVSGGTFVFDGFDMVAPSPTGGVGPVTVTGYLGAVIVATDIFSIPAVLNTPTAYTALNLLNATLDRLVINIQSGTTNTPLVDNVSLTAVAVSEPGTLVLLVMGLAGIGFARRHRHA